MSVLPGMPVKGGVMESKCHICKVDVKGTVDTYKAWVMYSCGCGYGWSELVQENVQVQRELYKGGDI